MCGTSGGDAGTTQPLANPVPRDTADDYHTVMTTISLQELQQNPAA
jgi:hypothetical protein